MKIERSWFFVGPYSHPEKNIKQESQAKIIPRNSSFGLMLTFPPEKREAKFTAILEVPSNPKSFYCEACKNGKLRFEENKVIVEYNYPLEKGWFAFYWAIGFTEPAGDYAMSIEVDGERQAYHEFKIE